MFKRKANPYSYNAMAHTPSSVAADVGAGGATGAADGATGIGGGGGGLNVRII